MQVHSHVYASQEYIARTGKPETVADLDRHHLIIFGEDARAPVDDMNWLMREGADDTAQLSRHVVLRVNNIYGMFRACESGLGIASIPDYLARESSKLVRVLPQVPERMIDVYFTYPEELRHSKRVAVFRDFLLKKVAETPF
jgi:DNA-binding transcriptional LysR family regulator